MTQPQADAAQSGAKAKPLTGVRVLEMGQLLAGPFCGRILAEFGAEVIKIEAPTKGDPLRVWRAVAPETNTSLWWYVQSRNKKSVTLDMNQQPVASDLMRQLIAHADVLVENFKPGTMEKWGLGWDTLHAAFPKLVMTRVSGWGQSGPYKDKAGYGSIGESMGGIRYVTGYPDRPPVRAGISLGDSLAGMWGAIGTLMAIYNRDLHGGNGQMVDVALNEAVFALMEGALPEFTRLGITRERTGAAMPGISPSNTYRCKDGVYIVIAGNGDSVFKRFMTAIGRADLASDPGFANNNDRVRQDAVLDQIIGEWVAERDYSEVFAILDAANVPIGPIYSVADIAADPHYAARGMLQKFMSPDLGELDIPGIVPQLSETPGETEWLGPKLGEHNQEIYGGLLGVDQAQLAEWAKAGVI